ACGHPPQVGRHATTSCRSDVRGCVPVVIRRRLRGARPQAAGQTYAAACLWSSAAGKPACDRELQAVLSLRSEALDDGGVGEAAALAHRLEAVAAAGSLELVEQRRQQLGARAAERVAQRDGAAVDVRLAEVVACLLLP